MTGYQNGFDSNLYVDCHPKQAFYGVESYHDNDREDRRWHFMCKNAIEPRDSFSHCYWTSYQNDWKVPLSFMCNSNYVMTGVSSYHSNDKEDRRWRFKCCHANRYKAKNCQLTSFINNWDTYMNYRATGSKMLVGAFSFYRSSKG